MSWRFVIRIQCKKLSTCSGYCHGMCNTACGIKGCQDSWLLRLVRVLLLA